MISQKGDWTWRAMSAETRKIPEPIIDPATSIVASVNVSAFTNSGCVSVTASGAAATLLIRDSLDVWRSVGSGKAMPRRGLRSRQCTDARWGWPERMAGTASRLAVAAGRLTRRGAWRCADVLVEHPVDVVGGANRAPIAPRSRPKRELFQGIADLPVVPAIGRLAELHRPHDSGRIDVEVHADGSLLQRLGHRLWRQQHLQRIGREDFVHS